MNVNYLQNIVFSFGGSNGQNHSLSDSHYPRFPILTLGEGGFPLKKTGDGSNIHTSKTSKFHVNDNPVTQYRNFRLLKTPAATPASFQKKKKKYYTEIICVKHLTGNKYYRC